MTVGFDSEVLKSSIQSILSGQGDNQEFLRLLEPAISSSSVLDPRSEQSLSLLMEDIEQRGRLNDFLESVTQDTGPPKFVIGEDGKIICSNGAAKALAGESNPDYVYALGVTRSDFSKFRERLSSKGGKSLLKIDMQSDNGLPLVFTGHYFRRSHYYILESLELKWSDSIELALHDIFRLTPAEREVLLCLARGMQLPEISSYRQSRITTVRQQVKSILQKTGCSSQAQATALAAALGDKGPSDPSDYVGEVNQGRRDLDDALKTNSLTTEGGDRNVQAGHIYRDGRRVGWRAYGHPTGKVALLMHSAYFGAANFDKELTAAYRAGFRIIVVERPGFGLTDEPHFTNATLVTHVKDCEHVLAEHSLQPDVLIGHDYGFVYALAFSQLSSSKVPDILAVSPIPLFQEGSDFSEIPIQQRVFIWAARHSFWLVRVLLRLGHVKARRLGPERWMEMVFEGAESELDIFQSAEGKRIEAESYAFNLAQNSKGHELDLQVCISSDWSGYLTDSEARVSIITGSENQTFSLAMVKALQKQRGDISISAIPTGLTLSVRHPELVYDLAKALS